MNFKVTLYLLVMLSVLGGFFYFVSLPSKTTDEALESKTTADLTQGSLLLGDAVVQPDAVTGISITREGKTVELAKEDGRWQQISPVRFPLNSWAATDTLIGSARKLRFSEMLRVGSADLPSLDEIKLKPPAASITFKFAGGKPSVTLNVGKKLTGGRGFLSKDNDPAVYLVTGELHKVLLEESINDWRAKAVDAPQATAAEAVELQTSAGSLAMQRNDGQWSFQGTQTGRVSEQAVSDLVSALDTLTISKFVADQPADLSRYGLDKPSLVLTVRHPSTKPAAESKAAAADAKQPAGPAQDVVTLRVGSPVDLEKQSWFATYESRQTPQPVVFQIGQTSFDRLNKTASDLRDSRLTSTKLEQVKQYTVARPDLTLTLQKGTDGWSFGEPGPGFRADQDETVKLLEQVLEAKAGAFVENAKPASTPVATLTLGIIGSSPDVLRIYDTAAEPAISFDRSKFEKVDKFSLVLREGETTGHIVPAADLARLMQPALALRDRLVLDLKPEQLKRITLQQDGLAYNFLAEPSAVNPAVNFLEGGKSGGKPAAPAASTGVTWKLQGHDEYEKAAWNDLLKNLLPLRATHWHEPGEEVKGIALTLVTADDKTIELTIDPAKLRAATAYQGSKVFDISPALAGALQQEFRPRTILSVSPADLLTVRRQHGDASQTLSLVSGEYRSAEIARLDPQAAAALFDALAGLRVARFVPSPAEPPKPTIAHLLRTRTGDELAIELHPRSNAEPVLAHITGKVGSKAIDAWATLEPQTARALQANLEAEK